MAGRVLALVHREGLLLWVQEVAHVLVGGLDAVGGDLGSGVGGEGVVGGDHGCPPFFCGSGWCGACLSSLLWSSIVTLSNSCWHSPLILCYNTRIPYFLSKRGEAH